MFTPETWLTIVCSMMIHAVIFGVSAILVLSIPALAAASRMRLRN